MFLCPLFAVEPSWVSKLWLFPGGLFCHSLSHTCNTLDYFPGVPLLFICFCLM